MFPGMIARATTTDVISSGMGGTRNGALQLVINIDNYSLIKPIILINNNNYCC